MATTKEALIQGLNQDLAHELQAVLVYLQQTSMALGLEGEEIRELLQPDIADEIGHAKFLAEKIVALGGEPRFEPGAFEVKTDVHEMLAYDLQLEQEAVADYKKRARQADELGELGLKVRLEEILAEETEHAEGLERILRGL
ncbi:MAG: bacterioferritin [Anaerolineae bacterium]